MFVFSNLATSLDGKIATADRALFHLGSPADRARMQLLRRRCDVLLMGAGTLRAHHGFCGVRGLPGRRQPANAVVSTALEGVSPEWPFFKDSERRRLLFLSEPGRVPSARRRLFEQTSEIVPIARRGTRPAVARKILEALERRGFRKLLIEGGGEVMWDFASANSIDEYHLTLTPKIIGGADSPTLVEGPGFAPKHFLKLKLHRCQRLGDELFLVYHRNAI